MKHVSFCTAVTFGDYPLTFGDYLAFPRQSMLNTVESYFYLGGRKAFVIAGHLQNGSEGTELIKHDSPHYLIIALKIISYLTGVIPFVMLCAKAVLRSIYKFHIIDRKPKQEHTAPAEKAAADKCSSEQNMEPAALQAQFSDLLSSYRTVCSVTEGTGNRANEYRDMAYGKLQTFVQRYPSFAAQLPRPSRAREDEQHSGCVSGYSALASSLTR